MKTSDVYEPWPDKCKVHFGKNNLKNLIDYLKTSLLESQKEQGEGYKRKVSVGVVNMTENENDMKYQTMALDTMPANNLNDLVPKAAVASCATPNEFEPVDVMGQTSSTSQLAACFWSPRFEWHGL